jgi:hypothetical protein
MRTFARMTVFSLATFSLAFAGATINPVASVMACGPQDNCGVGGALGGQAEGTAKGGRLSFNAGPIAGANASGRVDNSAGRTDGYIGDSTFTTSGRPQLDQSGNFTGHLVLNDPDGNFIPGGVIFRCSGKCTLPSP